ncbi:MAG TPA: nitrate ABC transporter ATP-binding protein [Chloroflexus aurantiacus]|jgi:NitT/TauT family transport system ATP-binding protein|uniref:ABC transporter related n=1 Tax=Chloroflexus aurantiacus (strain ATCC 29366 / DSM 635 / J-10-fl) TaxID=324602 RepID=A9WBU7_CHLAA|nr:MULTISPECIES: nitrate/sulfonate/bicarbonate ABC transporter ATP-binding protein [Chloroflexus]ABY36899.1 ABC transporter related [Chloroflexus aurantiacus J-10-fl]RMG50588.1 MAG: ATP-binding cassette domain-containing protein [Chloroflexota bacterium]HBW67247.1 nitrate ABC transporter ATP-binding protein [Chloroflexus aurantiacus]
MQQTQLQPLVEVLRVTQRYGGKDRQFTAIQDVNLTIGDGEFVALLGPSGCGKSTLLRIITGLNRPSEGLVRYRGQALHGVNPHATIVFQTFALFPWLTVQENVAVALQARGVTYDEAQKRAIELIDLVGLDGFEQAYPRELSGGMRQKVGIARALAVDPELLCLDEPFSALDVLSAETLRGEVLELWTSGKLHIRAVLMVSHNIEEAVFMADRIVVMDKNPGRVITEIPINLPHPRDRKSEAFAALVARVYAVLAGQTQPEAVEYGTEPGQSGQTRLLPMASVTALAGLIEQANASDVERDPIVHLQDELGLDLDQLLPLIEAAELLGFARVESGDLILTPLGEAFAEASIQSRKEIFASRLRRLPFFRWMMRMLTAADNQSLRWEVFLAALEREFPRAEAERQLDIALEWGRYAELFAYDDAEGRFFLEAPVGTVAG